MARWLVALALFFTVAAWQPFAAATVRAEAPSFEVDEDDEQADDESTDEPAEDEDAGEEEDPAESEDDQDEAEEATKSADSKNADDSDEDAKTKKKKTADAKKDEKAKADDKSEDEDAEKPSDDVKKKKAAGEEKAGDKKADQKKADEKEEKKEEEKKPETHKVEKKDLKIEVEVDGVFVAQEAEEVALRPEVWSSFKVEEAVPHGKRVRKGDVLVRFDDKDFAEALAEKTLEQQVGAIALMAAEEEFPRLEKSSRISFELAERNRDEAVQEYERFEKTMRSMSEKLANYYLKSAEQELDNAREELDQLEKMYAADELTEETEEIVLRRQKFMVQQAEFFMEYSKINHEYTMSVSIPRREELLSTAVEQAKIAFERAKTTRSLGLNKARYELEALREARARSVEKHAKLLADRSLMTLRAPADGVAYYGRAVNGRWIEVSSMESKLVPFGTVSPNTVVMTVVKDRPLYIETSVGEKELPTVEDDQTVTIVPTSDSDVELSGAVADVADVPGAGNKFAVEVKIKSDELPDWLMPGMTAKAKIKTYEVDEAIVIPAELVQSDEKDPKQKYVMLQAEGQDKPVRRKIKLGKSKDKEVEVLKGLKEGDLIVKGAKDGKEDEEDKKSDDKKAEVKKASEKQSADEKADDKEADE